MKPLPHHLLAAVVCGVLVLASCLITGCSQQARQEQNLRARYAALANALCQGDYAACVQLTNPEIVKAKGTDLVLGFWKLAGGLVKLGNLTTNDVRIDALSFNADFTTAELQTSYRFKGEWKPQKPSHWIRQDGRWYVTDK